MLVLIVLAVLPRLEFALDKWNVSRTYSIECVFSEDVRAYYEETLKQCNLKYQIVKQVKVHDRIRLSWLVEGHSRYHEQFITIIVRDPVAEKFEY